MNDTAKTILVHTLIVLNMLMGLYLGSNMIKEEAINTVCAEHNTTTGDFQWIKEYKR